MHSYFYQVNLMLSAEGFHQLHVHRLIAVGGQDAEMGLTPARPQLLSSTNGNNTDALRGLHISDRHWVTMADFHMMFSRGSQDIITEISVFLVTLVLS